ncbi:regulating synaptic membrane exocytosis protein 1-like isoform X2 [Ruditapes philippinarum]|uniref:regulating synaptic membrane exocytosis protein 1-like isoform X2 n=1 Tax=Ruditapes philippinarum TaxID=129788 RepID=UPI00295AB88B|nr:regulating synaptic membrane exocytosis protein 1-like isoform X2 [Ruditapes philippinarum]
MSATRRPSLPPMPDLSHLKEEERKIIEDVLKRQRDEEEREQEMIRQMQMEFDTYRQTVEKVGEEAKRSDNADTGAVCDICRKTKFADGVGHKCTYCNLKSCARCGGRVTVKNKTTWACNLCKKKQEILAKTGQWYHGGMARPVGLDVVDAAGGSGGDSGKSETSQQNDKRQKYIDKNESGHTSSEKENIEKSEKGERENKGPMTRQSSQLKRQYSLDAQRGKIGENGTSGKDSGDRSGGYDRLRERGNNVPPERGRARDKSPARHRYHSETRLSDTDKRYFAHERGGDMDRHGGRGQREALGNRVGDNRDNRERERDMREKGRHSDDRDPRRIQKEGPDRLHPEREIIKKESASRTRSTRDTPSPRHSIDEKSSAGDERERRKEPPDRYRQSPIDNFNNRSHDRPHDYADNKRERRGSRERVIDDHKMGKSSHMSDRGSHDQIHQSQNKLHKSSLENVSRSGSRRDRRSPTMQERQFKSPPQHRHLIHIEQASDTQVSAAEDIAELERNADTCKQHLDPNSAVAKTSRSNRRKLESIMRNDSLSSDPSDCVRPPPPKPHKHKRGKKQRQHSVSSSDEEIRSTPECSSCEELDLESESVSEKGGEYLYDRPVTDERWKKDEILEAKIKKFLSHPVIWQPSADGHHWIGHMILKKAVLDGSGKPSDSSVLGLKIVGGRMTDAGSYAAYITKVKKGSIADTVGHLRAGDEVIEWNGRSLQGATFEEVCDIVLESKQEPQVELIVHRSKSTGEVPPGASSQYDAHKDFGHIKDVVGTTRLNRPSLKVTSPESPRTQKTQKNAMQISGRIQVKLWYEKRSFELIITIISAIDLPMTNEGKFRNPYCKIYLLPDRSEKSKRRTRTVQNTNEPTWNQTFMYQNVKPEDFVERMIEITVWDFDRIGASEFLGEVLIDLTSACLTDEPYWYQLSNHDNTSLPLPSSSPRNKTSKDPYDVRHRQQMSPPHVGRGVSDSDVSEIDDSIGVVGGLTRDVDSSRRGRLPSTANEKLDVPDRGRRSKSPAADSRDRQRNRSRSPAPDRGQRSRSPAPDQGHRSRSPAPDRGHGHMRSRSPSSHHRVPDTVARSLSPTDLSSRHSSTSTPVRMPGISPTSTPSPKKRQLPAIPVEAQRASRDRVTQELEERARMMKQRIIRQAEGTSMPHSDSEGYRQSRHSQENRSRSRDRAFDREYDFRLGRDFGGGGYHHRRRREFGMDDDAQSDASETSDMSEVSKVSTISLRSTQSERPRKFSEFTSRMESRSTPMPARRAPPRSSSNDSTGFEKTDGSQSDSAVSSSITEGRSKRRPSLSHKMASFVGLRRRSSSANQLDGRKRSSFQRCEEVIPGVEGPGHMYKQGSRESTDGSISSDSGSVLWLPPGMRLGSEGQFGDFVEGLGPAQLVGRQVLGSACLGEIQLGLYDRKGHLEVEVIRARGLLAKAGAKILPAPYVKVYLIEGKHCIEKQKTTVARRTLDPLYQQQLMFTEPYTGKILQLTVWGDYGRMDRKVFMGVAQIMLDQLDLSNIVIGWYKLYTSSSLVGHHSSTGTLTASRKGSSTSLDSGYNNSTRT